MTFPTKSHGLRQITVTAQPRTLMDEGGTKSDPVWRAKVLSLYPEMFPGPLGHSLVGKALQKRLWTLETLDIRDFAMDKHRSVDDVPAGGGPGMVLKADVLASAIDRARRKATDLPVVALSARGRKFDQATARRYAKAGGAVFVCGRFEGIDQRVLEARNVEEISVGDAVYSGGEIPAMAVIDAVVRLIPGVLGKLESTEEESFAAGLLEHPQYTKPPVWEGRAIPEVLLSGHHANVAAWRRSQAEADTKERRPDLWRAYTDPDQERRAIGPESKKGEEE